MRVLAMAADIRPLSSCLLRVPRLLDHHPLLLGPPVVVSKLHHVGGGLVFAGSRQYVAKF